MKAKKIRAWAVVTSRGVFQSVHNRKQYAISRAKNPEVIDYEMKPVSGTGEPHYVVELTGTFTPPNRKGAKL